jgi:predicted nucleic acid-binding Zn ribbon protein
MYNTILIKGGIMMKEVVLLLLLIVLIYFAYIYTIRRSFRFKKEISTESIKGCVKDMEKHLAKIDNKIDSFIVELQNIAKQNKITTSKEVSQLEYKFTAKITDVKQEISNSANQTISAVNNQLSKSLNTIEGIHKYIVKEAEYKDAKIRECESGYNTKIVTKLFADSLIETLDYIHYELQQEKNKGNKILLDIQDDLLTLLSENNIKRLELKKDMLFDSKARKTFPSVKVSLIKTIKKSLKNKIVSIKNHGYYKPDTKLDSGKQIVRPAQIKIYDFNINDIKKPKSKDKFQQANAEINNKNQPTKSLQNDKDNHTKQENKK